MHCGCRIKAFFLLTPESLTRQLIFITSYNWVVSKQPLKAASVLKRGYVRSFCLPLCCTFRHLQHAAQACSCNPQPIAASFVICGDASTVLDTWEALLMKIHQDYTFRSLCWNASQWFLAPWLIGSRFLSMTDVWLAANFSQAPRQHIKEACVACFMVCVEFKFIGWWIGFKSSFHLIKDASIPFPSSRAKQF